MRVERLELTGIGPFRETQIIDFSTLSQSGLFLIDGPTGAGKTTIIDAIVFALFSGLSGENSSKERIRSDHSLPAEKSEVILDFSVHGRRHRITRTPGYQVAKPDGDGFTTRAAKQSLTEFNPDGTVKTTLTAAAEIGSHVSQLLNMQAAQFRQLVVLAQGEFAALLRMKPKDRLDALRGLLGTQFFRDLQTRIQEQGQASRQILAESRKQLEGIANRAATFRTADNCEELDALLDILLAEDTSAQESQDAFESIVQVFEVTLNAAQASHENAQGELEPKKAEFEAIAQLHQSIDELQEAKLELVEVERQLDPIDKGIGRKDLAKIAQSLTLEAGALDSFIQWENSHQKREKLEAELLADFERVDREYTSLMKVLESLPERIKALRIQVSEEPRLETKLETAKKARETMAELLFNFDQLAQAQSELHLNSEDLRVAQSNCESGELRIEQSRTKLSTLIVRQLEQRVAVLAEGLTSGEPCVVCGSTEHPKPAATLHSGEVVTEAEVATAEQELNENIKDLEGLKEKLDAAQIDHKAAELKVASLQGMVGKKSAVELAEELAHTSEEIDTLTVQLEELRELATELIQYEGELNEGELKLAELRDSQREAESKLTLHRKEEESARKARDKAVGPNTTASQLKDSLISRANGLNQYAEHLKIVSDLEKNAPSTILSPEDIKTQYSDLNELLTQLELRVSNAADVVAVASSQLNTMRELSGEFSKQLKTNERLYKDHEARIRVAGLVTAQSQQNVKKLPLESYALQLRFQHVLEAASHHLAKMSGGRLSFVLDEGSQSNALAGLGIEVLDSWTGEARPPQTLSGGETFYASLALALGLADVVQAETGGVSLETLFVDEGFGSLDQESLQLVLDQLDQLKSGGRVIGVISHVSEMKDRFPERIFVQPQSDGTSVVLQGI